MSGTPHGPPAPPPGPHGRRGRRRMLANLRPSPVLTKELVQLAISRRVFLLRLACVALLTGLTVNALFAAPGAGDLPPQVELTNMLGAILLALVLLLTPMVTAGLINSEREANTLNLLFLTRLTPLNIVMDKGLSRLVLLLNGVLLSVPLLYAGLLLGGLDMVLIACVAAAWVHAVLLAGGLGLLCSALLRRPTAALLLTYVGLMAWLGLTLTPLLLDGPAASAVVAALPALNPIAMIRSVSQEFRAGTPEGGSLLSLGLAGLHVAAGLVFYLGAVLLAERRVRHLARSAAAERPPDREVDPAAPVQARGLWRFKRLLGPAGGDTVQGNPFAWRCRSARNDSLRASIVGISLLLNGLLLAMAACLQLSPQAGDRARLLFAAFFYVGLVVATFALLINSVTVFTRERHGRTLDILLATRLSGRDIVRGALQSQVGYLALLLLLPTLAAIGMDRWDRSGDVIWWPPLLFALLYAVALVLSALRLSITARSHSQAVLRAFLLLLLLLLATPAVALILDLLGRTEGDDLMTQWPIWWLVEGFSRRNCWDNLRDIPQSVSRARAGLILHLVLVGAWIGFMLEGLSRFDQLVGRAGSRRPAPTAVADGDGA